MPITLTIPDEVLDAFPETGAPLERLALEAIVLNLYREGEISAGKVGELLGIARFEADRLLGSRGLLKSPDGHREAREDRLFKTLVSKS